MNYGAVAVTDGNAVVPEVRKITFANATLTAGADGEAVELDLGKVDSVARVVLNGREVAVRWCEPFSCELGPFVRKGRNELKVEVTGTWRNRIIYDLSLPESERKSWIRHRQGYTPQKEDPFVPNGISGPAVLRR